MDESIPGPADEERALCAAREVRLCAHAPYSQFRVGAALLLADGTLVTGCNVESASYGLTICAERAALAAWITGACRGGEVVLVAIATVAAEPTAPCGACRQWLAEFAPGARVVSEARIAASGDGGGADALLGRWSVSALLPDAFGANSLPGHGGAAK